MGRVRHVVVDVSYPYNKREREALKGRSTADLEKLVLSVKLGAIRVLSSGRS